MATKSIFDPRYQALVATLVEQRERLKISQAEFASRIDRAQQFVSRYENFERRLDLIEYLDIATALGIDGLAEAARCWKPRR